MKEPPKFVAEYRKVQERFNLPQLEKLRQVFQFELEEISDINQMRDEISEKLFDFVERVIEPLIWSGHHTHLMERDMLSEKEMQELFELYKKIQALRWRSNMLMIRPNADESARWIHKSWEFWADLETTMTRLCRKFSISWENLRFKNEKVDYNVA
ncbi:MAG: hypothetical protein HZB67_03775 [Candidatus Aenigmarchaeota archaeon]|nr:hypothetical protein [Candidatus Aenigmarchaeota archaeon]